MSEALPIQTGIFFAESSYIPTAAIAIYLLGLVLGAAILAAGLAIGWKISANPKRRVPGYGLTLVCAVLLVPLLKYMVHLWKY